MRGVGGEGGWGLELGRREKDRGEHFGPGSHLLSSGDRPEESPQSIISPLPPFLQYPYICIE